MDQVKSAPEPKASESIQVGGIIDTGKESFGVDILADVKAAQKDKAPVIEQKKQDAESPAAAAGSDKGADDKDDKKDTGKEAKADEGKLDIKANDDDLDVDEDKLPKGVIKRLSKMRAKQGDAERETARLRAENEVLKAAQNQAKVDAEEPDITTFETEAEYIKALTAYQVKKAMADKEVESTKKTEDDIKADQEAVKAERYANIQKNLKDAETKYDDFKTLVYENKTLKITEQMIDIMFELSNMGEVVYNLAKDPEKAAEIAGMTLTRQAFMLKDISDQLKSKKITNAPKPIKAIGATGGDIKSLSDMSYAEYKKLRDKQDKEKRGG